MTRHLSLCDVGLVFERDRSVSMHYRNMLRPTHTPPSSSSSMPLHIVAACHIAKERNSYCRRESPRAEDTVTR